MSKDSILIIDESDSKLDTIIDILNNNQHTIINLINCKSQFDNELINSYKNQIKQLEDQITNLKLELDQKNSKIERLERIKSDFKITNSNIDNRLKQNLLLRQRKPFPFNHFLSYDYTLGKY